MAKSSPPAIWVLAGVNGAGKSSIAGAAIRSRGGAYFNPDEAARRLMAVNGVLGQTEANALAWRQGRRLLERAVAERLDFAFETTLGGNTITRLLAQAARGGVAVHVWYAGLASAEQHLARIRSRVRRGGHDIPEADVRRRHRHSRLNLVHLLPLLTTLRVYDNSAEADPADGLRPEPRLVLAVRRGVVLNRGGLAAAPEWAKPIVAAALKLPPADARAQER